MRDAAISSIYESESPHIKVRVIAGFNHEKSPTSLSIFASLAPLALERVIDFDIREGIPSTAGPPPSKGHRFKPKQPQRIISGLRETFIKRFIVDRTNNAKLRSEERNEKAESCRENLWNEVQLKGPERQK